MSLYLYCVIDDDASFENVIFACPNEGISGSRITLFRVGDFALLVSDLSGKSAPVTRENVLKHAEVVGSLLPITTPLPFRFGTLAPKAELESYLNTRATALRAKQALVSGCVEMSVKIICNREWTDEPVPNDHEPEKPGTAFLAEKRRKILGSEARAEEAKRIASWLEERLCDAIKEVNLKINTTEKLLVTAAHLVERSALDRYRTVLRSAQAERPELHFLASGPWPPYSFANINLEFSTQFGVS